MIDQVIQEILDLKRNCKVVKCKQKNRNKKQLAMNRIWNKQHRKRWEESHWRGLESGGHILLLWVPSLHTITPQLSLSLFTHELWRIWMHHYRFLFLCLWKSLRFWSCFSHCGESHYWEQRTIVQGGPFAWDGAVTFWVTTVSYFVYMLVDVFCFWVAAGETEL